MEIKFDLKLTPKQQEVYDTLHKPETTYLVVRFSRQCGKTVIAEVLMIEYLLKSNTFSAYISPTFSQGQKVFKEILQILQPTGLVRSANATLLEIESIFGGQLKFFSMQSASAIRGNTIKNGLLVLDECSFFPTELPDGSEPWSSVIYPIVKANIKRNKVLMISTPKGKRGFFWNSYNNALQKITGWYEISATIYDDALISPEEIQNIKQSMSPLAFEEEFMVKFLDNSISFFQNFEKCFADYAYDETVPQFIGIDPSGNGQDDMILTKINSKGQTKSIELTGSLDTKYIQASKIINDCKNLKLCYIEINGLGSPICNEIKKLCKNKNIVKEWITTNESKTEMLSDLAVSIVKEEILFENSDTKLKSQFGTFGSSYTKTGKLQLVGLNNTHDDKILSLGLAYAAKRDFCKAGSYNLSLLHKN